MNHKKLLLVIFLIDLLEVKKLELLEKMVLESQHFFKMINDPTLVDEGSIKIKKNIEINYFDQSGIQLDNSKV